MPVNYYNSILSVFKKFGFSQTSQFTQKEINNIMKKIFNSLAKNDDFDEDTAEQIWEELWSNSIKQNPKGTVILKNYIECIIEALETLKGYIDSTIQQMQNGKSIYDEDEPQNDFFSYITDHNLLTQLFNLPNIKQNKKIEKYYLSNKYAPNQLYISSLVQQFDIFSPLKQKQSVNDLVKLGVECAGKKQYEEAISHWKKALQMDKNNYLHYANISRIIGVIGRFKEAIEYGEKAIKLNSQYPYAHLNLALGYAGQKRFEEALKHSQIALNLSPKDPLCYIDRANILTQAGRQQEADKFYDMADKLNTSSSQIKFNQDHINETLQRKFKKLNKYIDTLEGNKDQKQQLRSNVQGLFNDMLKSTRTIKASQVIKKQEQEVKQYKGKQSNFDQMEQRLTGLQQQFIQMADTFNKQNETKEIMLLEGKKHEDQIQKINRQVKRLREEMKEVKQCLQGLKTPTTSPSKQLNTSSSQSARINGQDLEEINAQLADITESTTALKIKIKKNNSQIKKSSVDLFCKFISKLNKLESLELFLRNHHEQFLSKLKNPLLKIESLRMIKIVSQNGQEKVLKSFKEEITLKKKSVSCEATINEWL